MKEYYRSNRRVIGPIILSIVFIIIFLLVPMIIPGISPPTYIPAAIIWLMVTVFTFIVTLFSIINIFYTRNMIELSGDNIIIPPNGYDLDFFRKDDRSGYKYNWKKHLLRVRTSVDNIERVWRVTDPEEIKRVESYQKMHVVKYMNRRLPVVIRGYRVRKGFVREYDLTAVNDLIEDAFHSSHVSYLHNMVAIEFKKLPSLKHFRIDTPKELQNMILYVSLKDPDYFTERMHTVMKPSRMIPS